MRLFPAEPEECWVLAFNIPLGHMAQATLMDVVKARITHWAVEERDIWPVIKPQGVMREPYVPILLPDGRIRHAQWARDGRVLPYVYADVGHWVQAMRRAAGGS